ncbi:hypothetical protein OG203_04990 [Nocardia sp. NBC_01499]|uniref:TY-Chap domain-containing protein n=1 Tax=Nocardia sp. NBC_01499 TaxID=2903597 RepID=UPI003866A0F3
MSTSIEVGFSVCGLSPEHAQAVLGLFERVVRDERFEHDVDVVRRDSHVGSVDVRVVSLRPVIFSRFYLWRPAFEERLQREVSGLVPGVDVSFEWDYPEQEAEEEAEAAAEAAEPRPAPANWSDFALRLAIVFRAVPDGGVVIVRTHGNRFTQFWRSHDRLFCEIVAAQFLEDADPMVRDGNAALVAAGWAAPERNMNWQRGITVPAFPTTYQRLAQQVVDALSQVLKIQMPVELKVQAWNDEGSGREPEVAVLGLMREPQTDPYAL